MISLYILVVLLAAAAVFLAIDDIRGVKLRLLAHIDENGMDLDAKFLYPFFKVSFYIKDNVPVYSVHIFKARVLKGELVRDTGTKKNFSLSRLLKSVEFSGVNISAAYGLNDPYKTGVLYGSLCAAGAGTGVESLHLSPDFIADREYIDFSADANLYLGQTIINFIKNK